MKKKRWTNPYEVLGVSPSSDNGEITKAFTLALKRREYSPDEIAKARKSLMNPQERIIADYLRPLLKTINRFKRQDFSSLEVPEPSLDLLPTFTNLNPEDDDFNKIITEKIFSSLDLDVEDK